MYASFEKQLLEFKVPARTSRGSYVQKEVYLLKLKNNTQEVIGEASPLPDLSIDPMEDMQAKLTEVCQYLNEQKSLYDIDDELQLQRFPSIKFALECVFEKLKHPKKNIIFPSGFTAKEYGIPINGLIWMDTTEAMLQQVGSKVDAGYSCIKLKIGALDFDEECRMLELIRKQYSAHKITLRVDANGAFDTADAMQKLNDLKRFELHSIEQPIKSNQHEAMQQLCAESKIAIALDEELIGINASESGEKIVRYIKPQYLILKPTLLGGFSNCNTWIKTAAKYNIGWWLTSALESNIGLNDIAQYCGSFNITLPQGLGTGALYINNFEELTTIRKGVLYYTGE